MTEYSIALEKQLEAQRIHAREVTVGARPQLRQASVYLAAAMELAEPFFISEPIGQLLATAAESMPDWTLDRSSLFAPFGFIWFESLIPLPPALIEEEGELSPAFGDLSALSWGDAHISDAGDLYWATQERPANTVAVACYSGSDEPLAEFPPRVPVMTHFLTWHDGWALSKSIASAEKVKQRSTRERSIVAFRLWAAVAQFISQRLLTTVKNRATRATRRRVSAMHHEPLINIVQLRRRSQSRVDAEPDDAPDWSCQWLVRGHWRQQWYPKLGRHQPIWITPYVKGPEDKPLKQPRATVFAVVR